MSESLRPTNGQLREWAKNLTLSVMDDDERDAYYEAHNWDVDEGEPFPRYYTSLHDGFLLGMVEELMNYRDKRLPW